MPQGPEARPTSLFSLPPCSPLTPTPEPTPNPQVPGVFHVVFGWSTPLLGFHDPLHPEFTDALHEWCTACRPNPRPEPEPEPEPEP